uniref:Uncharacterized protein n=1 Tax=Rhizophora mucronata TaxID=61149 RepID=A0A2P2R118_RHIMU
MYYLTLSILHELVKWKFCCNSGSYCFINF